MTFMNTNIVKDKQSFKAFCNYMKTVKNINQNAIYSVINYIGKEQLLSVLYALGIQGIDIAQKREYLDKVLMPLCLMSIVWKIKKVNPGGISASIFSTVLEDIKQNKTADNIQKSIICFVTNNPEICKINLNDFANGLDYLLERNTKKALLIMDVINKNTSGTLNVASINLEHIFPQSPDDEWILHGWTGNADEQTKIIDSIGNYMLLCAAVNRKIQNKYIDEKLDEYNKIIPLDQMLTTPLNTVNFALFEAQREQYIFDRQKQMAALIQQTFPGGQMLII